MLEAGPDGIGVDQECDLDKLSEAVPEGFPLAALAGSYGLMAIATVGEVRAAVRACLEKGITMAAPPADIYPPARIKNIPAFVDELRVCPKQLRLRQIVSVFFLPCRFDVRVIQNFPVGCKNNVIFQTCRRGDYPIGRVGMECFRQRVSLFNDFKADNTEGMRV